MYITKSSETYIASYLPKGGSAAVYGIHPVRHIAIAICYGRVLFG